MTASISIGTPRPGLTLSDLKTELKDAGQQQHLRFSDAKGLHTHSQYGASMTDFLAKFRLPSALQDRATLREGAVAHVKAAIENEYGKGMGDRVFSAMGDAGWNANEGVTKADLQSMSTIANNLREADITKAETVLGGNGVTDAIIAARDNGGCEVGHLDVEGMAQVRHAVAEAVNALPKPVSLADAQRAAQGAVLKHELLQMARDATDADPSMNKTGLNNNETTTFNAVMDSFFKPGGANTTVDLAVVRDVMASFLGRASSPTLEQVTTGVVRLSAQRQPLQTQANDIRAFIADLSDPTKEILGEDGSKRTERGLDDGALDSFMRSNVNKPTDPGFTSYAIIRGVAEESVKPSLGSAVDVIKGLGKFEYREDKLERLPPDEQRQIAQDSVRAFDQVMTHLLGGKDEASIDDAVANLSQAFCDLLATAHDELASSANLRLSQETIDKAPGKTPDERRDNAERAALESMGKKLDVNFFALRVINPMLVDAGVSSPKDHAKIIAVSKLVQDAANGVDPVGKGKEPVHPSVAGQLQQTTGEWGDAYAMFMAKATARGHVL